MQAGGFVAPDRLTLGGYLDGWLKSRVTVRLRPSTIDGYRWLIVRYVPDAVRDLRLKQLGATDLDRLYSDLLAGGGQDGRL